MGKGLPEDEPQGEMLRALAQAVQLTRWEEGWSRRELAGKCGLSERLIADVEHAQANPSLSSLVALAEALGLRVPEMLAGRWMPHPRLAKLLEGRSEADQLAMAELVEARDAGRRAGTRVAFVGLRGAGKTTVGRLVAKKLGCEFVELDRRVEERAGLPLAQLFEIHGEPYYRRLEHAVLQEVLEGGGSRVVETGGGLVSHEETYGLLRAAARTVWLKARPEEYLSRVLKQGDLRPVEQRPQALAELKALLAAREPAYAQAELTVDTTGTLPTEVADRVVAWLGRPARAAAR